MPAPRAVLIKYPYGAALGEAGAVDQQHTVLKAMFQRGLAIDGPGQVIELPFRWRRDRFEPQDLSDLEPQP